MVASSLAARRWTLALAREDSFAWAWPGTGGLDKEAQAAAEGPLCPRCPSATRSVSCFLLVGDSLLLVFALGGPLKQDYLLRAKPQCTKARSLCCTQRTPTTKH